MKNVSCWLYSLITLVYTVAKRYKITNVVKEATQNAHHEVCHKTSNYISNNNEYIWHNAMMKHEGVEMWIHSLISFETRS